MSSILLRTFCGQSIIQDQTKEIPSIIATFCKLSHTESVSTIYERFSFERPSGKFKTIKCRQFLERLIIKGLIWLPARHSKYVLRSNNAINLTVKTEGHSKRDFQPIINKSWFLIFSMDQCEKYGQRVARVMRQKRFRMIGFINLAAGPFPLAEQHIKPQNRFMSEKQTNGPHRSE